MKLDKGPKVALHLDINNSGGIISSRLFLSDNFCCVGADQTILNWIDNYLKGIHSPLPLIDQADTFQKQVHRELQNIPFGKTLSYSELADTCGKPKAARAVGNACNSNRFPLLIPCHRVIRSNGEMGGFAVDREIKRRLLEFEASIRRRTL